jgi:hypothetical protein
MGLCLSISFGKPYTYSDYDTRGSDLGTMSNMTFLGDDDLHYCLQRSHHVQHRKPKFYRLFNGKPLETVYEDELEY